MNEFMQMIYENWSKENQERNLFFKDGEKMIEELQETLSAKLTNKIYDSFCDSCMEIERNAFITGFTYACKCLSNGKIELSK